MKNPKKMSSNLLERIARLRELLANAEAMYEDGEDFTLDFIQALPAFLDEIEPLVAKESGKPVDSLLARAWRNAQEDVNKISKEAAAVFDANDKLRLQQTGHSPFKETRYQVSEATRKALTVNVKKLPVDKKRK